MSNLPRGKNADYWAGHDEEAAKQRTRMAADQHAELAVAVGRQLGRDRARKERIVARSPQVFYSMDAEEYGQASAAELATRELRELGITPKNSDPVELLDAHHLGREHARAQGRGVRGVAVKSSVMEGMDASGNSFMDKYLE